MKKFILLCILAVIAIIGAGCDIGEIVSTPAVCGDAFPSGGEDCDDGNTDYNDGCYNCKTVTCVDGDANTTNGGINLIVPSNAYLRDSSGTIIVTETDSCEVEYISEKYCITPYSIQATWYTCENQLGPDYFCNGDYGHCATQTCTESDGGANYNVAGFVEIIRQTATRYYDTCLTTNFTGLIINTSGKYLSEYNCETVDVAGTGAIPGHLVSNEVRCICNNGRCI